MTVEQRTDRAISWLGWHTLELAALVVTLALAGASRWFLAATLAVLIWVCAQEVRLRSNNRAIRRDRPAPADTSGSDDLASA
jgi:hypothetical protein